MGRFVIAAVVLAVGLLWFFAALQGQTGSLLAVILDPADLVEKK